MSRTPTPENMRTNELSPEYNEAHHPYCGLISSMHSWGLYHKRYGFSRFVVRARTTTSITVKTQYQPAIDALLANELARQERLKAYLATNPGMAAFVQDKKVLQNYKLLQFFDTLALYFNLYHAAERGDRSTCTFRSTRKRTPRQCSEKSATTSIVFRRFRSPANASSWSALRPIYQAVSRRFRRSPRSEPC